MRLYFIRASIALLVTAAALVSTPPSALGQENWSPELALPGDWTLEDQNLDLGVVQVSNLRQCTVRQSVWRLANSKIAVGVTTGECDGRVAAIWLSQKSRGQAARAEEQTVLADGPEWTFVRTVSSGEAFGRMWPQGPRAYLLVVHCDKWSREECAERNQQLSASLANSSSGKPVRSHMDAIAIALQVNLVQMPFAVWFLVAGVPTILFWLFRARFRIRHTDPVIDVRERAARLRYRSIAWGTATGLQRLVALSLLIYLYSKIDEQQAVSAAGVGISMLAIAFFEVVRRRVASVDFIAPVASRIILSRRPRVVAGLLVRMVARLLTVSFALLYLLVLLTGMAGGVANERLLLAGGAIAERVQAGNGNLLDHVRLLILMTSDVPDFFLFVLVLVAGAMLLADRIGLRLIVRSAQQAIQRDIRPPVMYLRSFDDDKLRLRASRMSRRGLLGRLAPQRGRRFEEVISWRLDRFGPLIAVSHPSHKLARLGAAKMWMGSDWLSRVQAFADTGLAVVISAAPKEITPGLAKELELVAEKLSHRRIVLIIPPRRRKRDLIACWQRFVEATEPYDVFDGLRHVNPNHAAQVIVHVKGEGWHAWGARSRSEWTYAVSVQLAMEYATARWSSADPIASTSTGSI
ncbi:hypothetical protein [Actinokineospora sp. UTMC 2448]|uniref:hypothetical protein n=1 Tax=Actinokineospora sp. UTMC 2448 TaxID=2268449 RepID=UPI0021647400|nr:hypothetical protein [Actinokineospora sp. UTMC 2448]UVS80532.1 hypothetical protein Actkin_04283 [Actinokineospora sp. UTMC 2448]